MTERDLPPRHDPGATPQAGGDDPLDGLLDVEFAGHAHPRERLVHVLQRLRDRHVELSAEAVELLGTRLGLSPVQVHGVVTFHRGPASADRRLPDPRSSLADRQEVPSARAGDGSPASSGELGELLRRSPEEMLEAVTRWASESGWVQLAQVGERWSQVASRCGPDKLVVSMAYGAKPPLGGHPESVGFDADLLVEGMILAARAVGASRGLVCLPGWAQMKTLEVEEAVSRIVGPLVGSCPSGERFGFEIGTLRGFEGPLVRNASALIAALEGRRGAPRAMALDPTAEGLWGLPTLIAGVETLVAVASFLLRGEMRVGVPVVIDGAVRRPGRARVDPETSILESVMDQGGGPISGRTIKAVLVGGATGVVIPAEKLDVPILGDSTRAGPNAEGPIRVTVIPDGDCIVDLARRCVAASVAESCGTCIPCRIGLPVLHEMLERVAAGGGSNADLISIQNLGELVAQTSMCGFGRTAPTPLLSSLRHFGHEFPAHVESGGCGAICTVGEH